VEAVAWEEVSKYGVVDCLGAELTIGGTAKIEGMVEKPAVDTAPSNMAVVGRYILPAEIWDLLEQTQPGAGGEIQLTDAIDQLLKNQTVEAYRIVGHSHDCGNKLGYMKAQFAYGLRHAEIGEGLSQYLANPKNTTPCSRQEKVNVK
jgi:UTP--glucose-1-phosphate uridylyltransferase